MTMTIEKSLRDFDFWGGAASNAAKLTTDELDQIESLMEEWFGEEPPTTTEVNDCLWFSFEFICESLDLDVEEVMARE